VRFAVGVLLCLNVGAVSLALADPVGAPPAPLSAAPPAPAPTAAQVTAPAGAPPAPPASKEAAAPVAAPPAATAPAVDPAEKRLLAAGYKPELHNGVKVWCRRQEVIGSRLAKQKMCGTARDLAIVLQETKDRIEGAQRQQTNPVYH
jgi:hypothetical protein